MRCCRRNSSALEEALSDRVCVVTQEIIRGREWLYGHLVPQQTFQIHGCMEIVLYENELLRWSMEYNYIEKRYNVMGLASIEAFAGIKGGMNGNCKDVYFLRAAGVNQSFSKDIAAMDETQTGRMLLGQGIYNRVSAFPKNIEVGSAERYMGCYRNWLDTGRERLFTLKLDEKSGLGELLGASCKKVLEVYHTCNPKNESIEKNFVVKMLFWLDELAFGYLKGWNPRQSMKFVAQGVTKGQEYFFCYFLTLLGIDVLLLQNEADIDEKLEALQLSRQIILGEKSAVALAAYDSQKYAVGKGNPDRVCQESGQVQTQTEARMPRVVIPPGRHGTSGNSSQGAGMSGNTGGNAGQSAGQGAGKPGNTGGNAGQSAGQGAGKPGNTGGNAGQSAGQGAGKPGNTGGNAGQSTRSGAGNAGPGIVSRSTKAAGSSGAGQRGTGSTASSAAGGARLELDFEELALKASSVVMISIHDGRGEIIGSGSGIMIGREGYILTNNHVARGGRFYSVRIENDDNMYRTEEIIKYNSLLDLAVIRIDRKLQPLPVYRGRKPLVRGQKVVAIGSPLGLFNSVSNGIISGFRRMNDVDMIQFTAPISHGSSGGAVLNMYGEVIGVSTAGIDEGQNLNLAVGYEFINTFIKGFL